MRSLGVNTILFNIGMVLVFSYLTNWIELNWPIPDNALLVSLIIFWALVLCWQSVGAFRAATVRIKNYGSVSNYYAVFAIMLACAVFTMASVATQYGEAIDYAQRAVDEYEAPQASFNIRLTHSNQLMLTGDIGHGATKKLNSLLAQNPKSTVLVLNSKGGLIAESRGLANTIKEHGLNTHVKERCYSACALAFIAGKQRSLAKDALLGFHQYYLEYDSSMPWIDAAIEQHRASLNLDTLQTHAIHRRGHYHKSQ